MKEKEVVICVKVEGVNHKVVAYFPRQLNYQYGGDWALKYIDKRSWTYRALKPTTKQATLKWMLTPYQISTDAFFDAQEKVGACVTDREFEAMLFVLPVHHYYKDVIRYDPERDIKSKDELERRRSMRKKAYNGRYLSLVYVEYHFFYFKKSVVVALENLGQFVGFKDTLKLMFEMNADIDSIRDSIDVLTKSVIEVN